jgi:predicted metal-dependent phosphoesterase TrpH
VVSQRIDLHTHSRASDGTQSPAELMAAAAAAGLDVVGLTDHDSTAGWDEAVAAAAEVGVGLVRGIEISARYQGRGVHLLAYLPDPAYPPLAAALTRILEGRTSRMPEMVRRLRYAGVELSEADVLAEAGDSVATGRPHVADALVRLGIVADRDEAFARYLSAGRPGYVDRYAADLTEMVGIVVAAGGVPVIAHPWGRGNDLANLGEDELAGLAEAGLAGLEVDHEDHAPSAREELRTIAGRLGLLVTGSSDHHGAGKVDHDLGCNTTAPAELERLLDLAARHASDAGRDAPTLLTG